MESYNWIGLSDSLYKGTWLWLNGNRASPDDGSLWHPGHPLTGSRGNNSDCAVAIFGPELFGAELLDQELRDLLDPEIFEGLSVWDSPCSANYQALCEKPV